MSALRRSPLAAFEALTEGPPSAPAHGTLWLRDHSLLPRLGLKGKGVATWLKEGGLPVPQTPNSWLLDQGTLIVRLGFTEFLIEGPAAQSLDAKATSRAPAVYPFHRPDVVLALSGTALLPLLAQACALDLVALTGGEQKAVLTTLVGVNVLLLGSLQTPAPRCLLWADNSYGLYLANTLRSLSQDLGARMTVEPSSPHDAESFIRSLPHPQGKPI